MHLGVIRASDKCRSKEPLLYHSNDFNDTLTAVQWLKLVATNVKQHQYLC